MDKYEYQERKIEILNEQIKNYQLQRDGHIAIIVGTGAMLVFISTIASLDLDGEAIYNLSPTMYDCFRNFLMPSSLACGLVWLTMGLLTCKSAKKQINYLQTEQKIIDELSGFKQKENEGSKELIR